MRRPRAIAPRSAASRPARVLAGENHGLVGFLSHDLGRVRREQRDWREARRWFERAVAVRKATEEAAPLAESLAQLGSVCRASNDLAAAAASSLGRLDAGGWPDIGEGRGWDSADWSGGVRAWQAENRICEIEDWRSDSSPHCSGRRRARRAPT